MKPGDLVVLRKALTWVGKEILKQGEIVEIIECNTFRPDCITIKSENCTLEMLIPKDIVQSYRELEEEEDDDSVVN